MKNLHHLMIFYISIKPNEHCIYLVSHEKLRTRHLPAGLSYRFKLHLKRNVGVSKFYQDPANLARSFLGK